jgi:hypothetical protein
MYEVLREGRGLWCLLMMETWNYLVLRCIRFAEATCSRILEGFCKSHRDFMAMCCVEAAVGILHPGRPLQLATGGDGNKRFSPFISYHGRPPSVSSSLYNYCWALRTTPDLAGADSLWRPPVHLLIWYPHVCSQQQAALVD